MKATAHAGPTDRHPLLLRQDVTSAEAGRRLVRALLERYASGGGALPAHPLGYVWTLHDNGELIDADHVPCRG